MGDSSAIEWTDATWNPVRGCSRVSEGCRHCYAEGVARRFAGPGQPYEGLVRLDARGRPKAQWNGHVRVVEEHLADPIRWRRPRRIFVNSMSDLFHESLSFEVIAAVFGVMAVAKHHTFQVLTKRAARLVAFVEWLWEEAERSCAQPWDICHEHAYRQEAVVHASWSADRGKHPAEEDDVPGYNAPEEWARHILVGVSVEDQATADERIPHLLQFDLAGARRFVSYEPAIGPVDFGLSSATCGCCPRWPSRWVRLHSEVRSDCIDGVPLTSDEMRAPAGIYRAHSNQHGALSVRAADGRLLGIRPSEFEALARLDWIVVGGESGSGARPFDVAWARSTITQCRAAAVPVFVKQLGAHPVVQHPMEPRAVVSAHCADRKGGDPDEWPTDLRVREWPHG